MGDVGLDLNQTITAAVNARIEAEMMKALSGDETIGKFVAAALRQEVEVRDGSYRTAKEPFLTNLLRKAIQTATEDAVRSLIAEELPLIEAEVRKALRRDINRIASTLSASVAAAAAKTYGVKVDLSLVMPSGDA